MAGRDPPVLTAPVPATARALRSVVLSRSAPARPDVNGFLTALAAREVRLAGRPVPDAWLDVLASCRRPDGAFGFWPAGAEPDWAPRLPTDSDDTAVMTLELVMAGRMDRADARRTVCRTIAAHRLVRVPDPGPPWLRRGVFSTWHSRGSGHDLVDVSVVCNVLAVLAALDLLHLPGVAESMATLERAASWAGDHPTRWWSLSPFYAEPEELGLAADHARSAGIPGLEGIADHVRRVARRDPEAPYLVCSSPYGAMSWECQELGALRAHLELGRR